MSTQPGIGGLAVTARASVVMNKLADRVEFLEAENAVQAEKLAGHDRSTRIHRIAAEMDERGLNGELTLAEKVASLHQVADLDTVEAAIKMAAAGRLDLAEVSTDPGSSHSGVNSFLTFCRTGQQ